MLCVKCIKLNFVWLNVKNAHIICHFFSESVTFLMDYKSLKVLLVRKCRTIKFGYMRLNCYWY